MGGARLTTRTRAPPTTSTSAFKSVEVATTARGPPPHAGAAASRSKARASGKRHYPRRGASPPFRNVPPGIGCAGKAGARTAITSREPLSDRRYFLATKTLLG